jgi:ComF family protein
MNVIFDILSELKNVIFPNVCPACQNNVVPDNRLICTQCQFELPFTDHFEYKDNKVASHFYGRVKLESAAGLLFFSENSLVQDIIHSFKYNHNKEVGVVFGKITGEKMLMSPLFRNAQVIIPVPLHPRKEYIRGYNQSFIFGEAIARTMKINIYKDVLIKVKSNDSQTGKNRIQRVRNVFETYALKKPDIIKGKHVVLVDDVITTGATLEACIQILSEAQPSLISVVTLACAR